MRGDKLHNMMGFEAGIIMCGFFSQVIPEYRYRRNGTVTYFDLFAREGKFVLAVEIETTCRHGFDNAIKADNVGIPLWIIVPISKVKLQLLRKLKPQGLRPGGEPIKILLLGQLERELEDYLSLYKLTSSKKSVMAFGN